MPSPEMTQTSTGAGERSSRVRTLQMVALDFDGTIAQHDRVSDQVRDALIAARRSGLILLLVTGRSQSALSVVLGDAAALFDAVVTENGAVVEIYGRPVHNAGGVDVRLQQRLASRGISFEAGHRILSVAGHDEHAVLREIADLELDVALQRNLGALMITVAGVSKGTGLQVALHHLGRSRHNLVAVGDAENDLSMFAVAEVSVAVSDAIPEVQTHADIVLSTPGDRGVIELLTAISDDWADRSPVKGRLRIGSFSDGSAATVSQHDANVLIVGNSGAGKSHVAGLLVERWHQAGYRVLVVDVEGDYRGLARLPGVAVLSHSEAPGTDVVKALLRMEGSSVVIDLSEVPFDVAAAYLPSLPAAISLMRRDVGAPHWVVLDEAHSLFGQGGCMQDTRVLADRGFALVTYQPWDLPSVEGLHFDTVLNVVEQLDHTRRVLLSDAEHDCVALFPDERETPHVRHWHKYAVTQLTPERWFWFTTPDGDVAAVAHNMTELAQLVQSLPRDVLDNHLRRHDLSRYFASTKNPHLAEQMRCIENGEKQKTTDTSLRDRLSIAIADPFGLAGW